ncbi:RagB/SusD family nutrient uptake outer membrane protein [Ekhidna sp.]
MKRILKICSVMMLVIITSCDDFLDVEPVDELSSDVVFESENDFFIALNGAYNSLQQQDYYGGDFMIIADASSDNGIIPADAETSRSPQFYQLNLSPAISAIGFWDEAYQAINRVNNVLEQLDGAGFPQASIDRIRGEALFIRAISHFDLTRIFAQDYNFTTDNTNLGVPIITSTEVGTPARNTIAEVYEFILDELRESASLLRDNDRLSNINVSFLANSEAAIALKARVFLYQSNYDSALDNADQIINSGKYSLVDYLVDDGSGGFDLAQINGWSDPSPTSEAILEFEVDRNDDGYPGLAGLAGYYQKGAGNAVFGPNLDIVNLYEANDVRNNWYVQDAGIWHVNKYPGQGDVPLQYTSPAIRLTEMYLIKAECEARLNDEVEARTAINAIRQRANVSDIASSGQTLLADILEERRRELAFEGHRYFDLKRLQQDIVRNDCSLTENCVVLYGDKFFAYPIPIEETAVNPNILQEGY